MNYRKRPEVFQIEALGPHTYVQVADNIFSDKFSAVEATEQIEGVEAFEGKKAAATNLLNCYHEGMLMVAQTLPEITKPTPLWIEFGRDHPPAFYVINEEDTVSSVICASKSALDVLSNYEPNNTLPLPEGIKAGSWEDYRLTPSEFMLAAGVEEAHHAIVAQYGGLEYGIGINPVDASSKEVYMAQEVEWQAAHFVLEALKVTGASFEAIATQERRMKAAEEIRKIVGLDDISRIPYLEDFKQRHNT